MPDKPYKAILDDADAFFGKVLREQPGNLQCGRGCSLCCHGLFEIGAGDLASIADGLATLHPMRRKRVIRKALEILESSAHPDLRDCQPEERDAFFERTSSVPCPNLDDEGACVMYAHRPIVCRTFGLPLREGATYIGDICELNFTAATREEKESAAWDLLHEDILGTSEVYTIPEAIVLAARARGWV
jgi:Fe-S-cluster containining protein